MRACNHNHLQPRQAGRMQHPASEDLQTQDSVYCDMRQIPINLVDNLCPTLMSRAFEKARVSYFLGQGNVWSYPAILIINDNKKQTP